MLVIEVNEEGLNERFKSIIMREGFIVVKEFVNVCPDLIIEKGEIRAGVELKADMKTSWLPKALGQLLFSKVKDNVNDLWLIIPRIPSALTTDWVKLFTDNGIKIFFINDDNIVRISGETVEKMRFHSRKGSSFRRSIQIDNKIMELLKDKPNGLTFGEISRMLDINWSTVRGHIIGPFGVMDKIWVLKDRIVVEGNRVKLKDILSDTMQEGISHQ